MLMILFIHTLLEQLDKPVHAKTQSLRLTTNAKLELKKPLPLQKLLKLKFIRMDQLKQDLMSIQTS